MPEFLRPDADDETGNWTNEADTTPLFSSIDESSAGDSDFIKSGNDPAADVCRFRLTNPAVALQPPGKVRVRYEREGPGPIALTVRLREGTVVIAQWVYENIANTFTTAEETLTSGEYASIADFDDLFIELEANSVSPFAVAQRDGELVVQRDGQQVINER
jgi:hypothetical protein